MPKLRCPYCKHLFTPEHIEGLCPVCAKAFVVPGKLRQTSFRERQRMRSKIASDADRQRRELMSIDINPGRNPRVMVGIMLVLVVIGGLVIGRANRITPVGGQQALSREDRATRELTALRAALELFKVDTGRYPTAEEGLKALVLNPGITNWGGNYVTIVKPDPWRKPYHYTPPPEGPAVRSVGPDWKLFTEDDILPGPLPAETNNPNADVTEP